MFNLEFKKIKKIFSFKTSDRLCFDCSCGWISLLLFFVILNVSLVVFSIFLHIKISKGEAFVVEGGGGEELNFSQINKSDLDKIIYDFSLKKDYFDNLKQKKSINVVDPSL